MLPREHVAKALSFKEPDLVPWGEHSIDYTTHGVVLGRPSLVQAKMKQTRMTRLALLVGLLAMLLPHAALAGDSAQAWLRQLLPLPHEITLGETITVPVAAVKVTLRPEAGDVAATGARLLSDRLGLAPDAAPAKPALEIVLGRCTPLGRLGNSKVPGADRLRGLKNNDQAYVIAPLDGNTLALTGLTEKGVFYAAVTLAQLIEKGKQADRLTLPMLRVVDWPDLNERGEWGGSAGRDVEWLASQKMNVVEEHSSLSVSAEGRGEAQCNPKLIEQGRLHALKIVPIITHLDQLGGTGLYQRYPETKGKGPDAAMAGFEVVAPCLSQPRTAEVIADWMVALAQQEGVSSVCLWLGENGARCGCDQCKTAGQFVLETRAAVRAWRLAVERNPKIKLRLLLTQGSYPDNDKVLAEVPEGVEVSYYDGGRTYDSSRDPMIYPLLADYAKQGRWLGCYPQLTASWRIVCPWSGPQFIKYRMTEFVDKGLTNLTGYATPDNRLYDFNVSAAAEWGWNVRGREEHEFAAAWATRRDLKDPDKVADWAVMLGPVGWDVYGSGVPFSQFFGPAANLIRNRQAPVLGKGMFRYFPTAAHLAEDMALCDRALKLAESVQAPALVAETKVIQGYVVMLDRLYALGTMLSRPTPPNDAERAQMNRDLFAFSEAGGAVTQGLQDWERATGGDGGSRLTDTIQVTEQTVADVSKSLAALGLTNPSLSYFRVKAGAWKDEDFEPQEQRTLSSPVSSQVAGPGPYEVTFTYTAGWHGLTIQHAALVASATDAAEGGKVVAEDKHPGVAACQNQKNVYTLKLNDYDAKLRYFLVVEIRGVRSSDKPENRRGCQGTIMMRKVRVAGEATAVPPLGPLAPEELARYGGPKFTTTDRHVAVLMGGYGSDGILAALQGKPGVEVRPLWAITAKDLATCQVVILPQPRNRDSYRPETAALLQRFVQGGGGLIGLHDAVGFRGLPVLFPEIASGSHKVRQEEWVVTGDHPVVAGLAKGTPLAHSYYDFIALQAGPQGEVVARGASEKAPVVVCGPVGQGRYVAAGLIPGLSAEQDAETAPTAAEVTLLVNAARWAGGQ